MEKKTKIIAVIPAYNEEDFIEQVVKNARLYTDEVIVVNDGSLDNTHKLARKAGAIVLKHIINLKKGAALKTGCEGALLRNADIIVTLDGDGQHDPHEIPRLINCLIKNNVELVIGTRDFNKDMPINSRFGNSFLSKLTNTLFKSDISDSQTGFRAFKTKIYPQIIWESSSYSVETEMIKNMRKHNLPYSELKVKTIYNDDYKGTNLLEGIKIVCNMFIWRFKK